MEAYHAAALQMNSQPDIDHNLEQAYRLINRAKEREALLVGLPENFAFLGDSTLRLEHAAQICERAEAFLKETAKEFGIYLLGGSYPVPNGNGKVFNRSTLISPDGKQVAKYDKIHLFDVDLEEGESYRESDQVEAGEISPVCFNDEVTGNIGLTICYDVRFPEIYRSLSAQGADVLTVPSAFTETTGKVHWETLLKARAIENTAYVFAPAQTGLHGKKRRTYGHALIVDPWGEILGDAGVEPGVVVAELKPDRIREVRQRIPSLQHRRMGIGN